MAFSNRNIYDADLALMIRSARRAIERSKELMTRTEELLRESRELLRVEVCWPPKQFQLVKDALPRFDKF
jgi:hypothetical protein